MKQFRAKNDLHEKKKFIEIIQKDSNKFAHKSSHGKAEWHDMRHASKVFSVSRCNAGMETVTKSW